MSTWKGGSRHRGQERQRLGGGAGRGLWSWRGWVGVGWGPAAQWDEVRDVMGSEQAHASKG